MKPRRTMNTYTALNRRPYKLVWTDSCRHTQAFASLAAALSAAALATPCNGTPCAWIIVFEGETRAEGER